MDKLIDGWLERLRDEVDQSRMNYNNKRLLDAMFHLQAARGIVACVEDAFPQLNDGQRREFLKLKEMRHRWMVKIAREFYTQEGDNAAN